MSYRLPTYGDGWRGTWDVERETWVMGRSPSPHRPQPKSLPPPATSVDIFPSFFPFFLLLYLAMASVHHSAHRTRRCGSTAPGTSCECVRCGCMCVGVVCLCDILMCGYDPWIYYHLLFTLVCPPNISRAVVGCDCVVTVIQARSCHGAADPHPLHGPERNHRRGLDPRGPRQAPPNHDPVEEDGPRWHADRARRHENPARRAEGLAGRCKR